MSKILSFYLRKATNNKQNTNTVGNDYSISYFCSLKAWKWEFRNGFPDSRRDKASHRQTTFSIDGKNIKPATTCHGFAVIKITSHQTTLVNLALLHWLASRSDINSLSDGICSSGCEVSSSREYSHWGMIGIVITFCWAMQTGGRIQPIERVKTKKFLFALNNNDNR